MAPKSKLRLIMATLLLRKKKICSLALLVMLDRVENEETGRRFWVRNKKIKKIRSLSHINRGITSIWYFFHFVRMIPQRFEQLLSLVGPRLQRVATKTREPTSWFVAELAGIFVECSFKFISRLKAYDTISKKIWYLVQCLRLCLKAYVDSS